MIRWLCALMLALTSVVQAADTPVPLITRGPVVVTSRDVDAFLLRVPEALRSDARASLDRVASMADSVFVNRAMAAEARKAGVLDDPLVKLRGEQVLEAYQAAVYLEHLEKSFKSPPSVAERAREIYLSDRSRYVTPESYELDQVLVGLWGRTEAMGLERAREVRQKLVNGADFEAIAREYSNDPAALKNNGHLGTVQATAMDADLAAAVAKLPVGEYSQPIKTRAGFHIMKVVKRTPARQMPFDEVREGLVEAERAKLVQRMIDEKLKGIRNDPATRVDSDAMKALVVPLNPREPRS